MARVSFAEFAKIRGVSRAAVTYAVQAGRLTAKTDENGKRYLDSEQAMAEWEQNTDHGKRASAEGRYNEDPEAPKGQSQDPAPDEEEESEPTEEGDGKVPTLNQSRAIREAFKARLEKLNYEERVGILTRVEDVQQGAFRAGRLLRDAMMGIADRIAPQLAAESNQFKCHKIVNDEIRRALEGLKSELGEKGNE